MLQIIFHLLNIDLAVFLPLLRHTVAPERVLIIGYRLLYLPAPIGAEFTPLLLSGP
ncbi:hypothetical protein D3C77_541160 [compost metagenome]